ncbi:MAG: DEAD/DEAH box helicase, partial [Bauldia sp.]|nr:DEAD/DEAH box helicase [Bauldia sp.]
RKRDVAVLARSLQRHGFSAGELHGDMDQHARLAMLDGFRKGELTFLVASDVAARGLDIPDVSHVFNFDVPTHPEDYVHRIGRTGRAGRKGAAITLVTAPESKYIAQIEKLIGQAIPVEGGAALPAGERVESRGGRGRGRGRGGERSARPAGGERPERAERQRSERAPSAEPVATVATQSGEPRREKPRQKPRADERHRTAKTRDQQANQRQENRPQPIRPGGPSAQRGPLNQPEPSRQQRDRGGRQQRDLDTVGLGDHVPDFLRRPVRPPSSSS